MGGLFFGIAFEKHFLFFDTGDHDFQHFFLLRFYDMLFLLSSFCSQTLLPPINQLNLSFFLAFFLGLLLPMFILKVKVLVAQLCSTLSNSMDCSQASLSVGFYRQEYWSG